MSPFFLVPVLVGIAAVVQAGMNRLVAQRWGLAGSVTLSAGVLFASALALLAFTHWAPNRLPDFFHAPKGSKGFELWFPLPGLLGLVIVAGFPWAIQRVGAAITFVVVIAAQIMVGLIWDMTVEGQPFSGLKTAGAALAVLGAGVAAMAR